MNEWIKQYSPNFNIARPGSESILSNTGHLASCGSQAGGQNKRITFFLSYRLSVWLKSERQHCLVASMKQAWWVHLNYKKNIQSMSAPLLFSTRGQQRWRLRMPAIIWKKSLWGFEKFQGSSSNLQVSKYTRHGMRLQMFLCGICHLTNK